jgi:hypothetical protein
MFKADPNPTFEAWVSGFVPGGSVRDGLMVTYRYKTPDEMRAWVQSFNTKTMNEVLLEVIVGWKDSPHEFSAEAIDKISAKYPAFREALINKYHSEFYEAKQKN